VRLALRPQRPILAINKATLRQRETFYEHAKRRRQMSNILLVHGAWGGAWEFEEVIAGLHERGHQALAIDLPGHGELSDVARADVTMNAYVDRVVESLEEQQGNVTLVGHSLAGAVISQVAERVPEKIARLIYVAAMLPANGDTPLGSMKSDRHGKLLAKLVFSSDESYATLEKQDIIDVLLHDVDDAELAEEHADKLSIKQATAPFMATAQLSNERFGGVPKHYICCTLDRVLSPLQDRMIEN
jgi:pimeloyl-ACP methyl ester carboxylesterase